MTIAYSATVILLLLLGLLAAGSLLSLSSDPHWFVRGWDFPRVQIVMIAWILVTTYAIVWFFRGESAVLPAWPCLALALALTAWHGYRILPYTTLSKVQSQATPVDFSENSPDDSMAFRIVMSNVEMENTEHDTWMRTMRDANPDVLLVVEVDETWIDATDELIQSYPFRVIEPQDNWYGMMLLSRLPIVEHKVRHLVEDDVPSIDARIRLGEDAVVRFVGVHPRPPEPIRNTDATARDAELTLWGTELAKENGPVVIGGDLNDVAWSETTRLFLRVSGLLDPRRGRGFFNTFHADHWYMRFPLDHIFHSPHFTVSHIERLGFVGSDHFPILIDLRYSSSQAAAQPGLEEKPDDDEEVEVRLDRAIEEESLQGDAVDEGKREEIEDVDQAAK